MDLRICSTSARTRSRPDMAWLMSLVMTAEANPEIRKHLSFLANPLAVIEGGRVTLAARAPTRPESPQVPVSVRATGVVKRALELARFAIPYQDLMNRLREMTPSARDEKLQSCSPNCGSRHSCLRIYGPPLTASNPALYVAERLAPISAAGETAAKPNRLMKGLSHWDGLNSNEKLEGFKSLLTASDIPLDGSQPIPVQVDMAMSIDGRIGRIVGEKRHELPNFCYA